MTIQEIGYKIQEAVDALLMAKENLVSDVYVFDAEQYLEEAKDCTLEAFREVRRMADEQEKQIAEEDMAKGYEVINE